MGFFYKGRIFTYCALLGASVFSTLLTSCQKGSIVESRAPASAKTVDGPSLGVILELSQPSIISARNSARSRRLSRTAMTTLTNSAKTSLDDQQTRVKNSVEKALGKKFFPMVRFDSWARLVFVN